MQTILWLLTVDLKLYFSTFRKKQKNIVVKWFCNSKTNFKITHILGTVENNELLITFGDYENKIQTCSRVVTIFL